MADKTMKLVIVEDDRGEQYVYIPIAEMDLLGVSISEDGEHLIVPIDAAECLGLEFDGMTEEVAIH